MSRVISIFIILLMAAILSFILVLKGMSRKSEGEPLKKYSIPFPTVIAHRGLSYLAPEETRPAYLLAVQVGADYLEMDVQRTKDGVLVAIHDDTLQRTTNIAEIYPSRINDTIGQFTYEELMQLDAGSWFNQKYPERKNDEYKGLKILTFEEIIEIAEEGDKGLMIETKNASQYKGYEKEIVHILKRQGWLEERGKVIFQSFEIDSLEILKELAPTVPRLLLIVDFPKEKWEKILEGAKEVADGIGPAGYQCWPWNMNRAHEMGFFIFPYTIDHVWQMWPMLQFGADGMFTNRADLALQFYQRGYSNSHKIDPSKEGNGP